MLRSLLVVFAGVVSIVIGNVICLADPVDFSSQIRPILSDRCFLCHGPDNESREAELRLDRRDSAVEDRGDYAVIVPGKSGVSELVARIVSDDPSSVMPPPETQKSLSADEIELLRRWIDEGARYDKHWAFVAPVRPPLPAVSDSASAWVRNPIDQFVVAKLEREGLMPSKRADQVTLLRRLHLDLTGLPPTIREIDQYVADTSDSAHQELVDRLLASPHYGERWGRQWLDAARYADSDGYEKDLQRDVWPWRDWVIRAFNDDMPYDRFILEQIAGDLILDASREQVIATGFLRNSMVNEEGGADPEQFRVEGIFDRMDAIGKSILGITTKCAQCHSHKYDPLTQADFYGMFAFLNNCEETYQAAYTDEQYLRREKILSDIHNIEEQLQHSAPNWRDRLATWAHKRRGNQPEWTPVEPTELPFEGQKFRVLEDGSILSESYAPPHSKVFFGVEVAMTQITAVRLELLTHPQLPGNGPGRSRYGTGALTEFKVFVEPLDQSSPRKMVKFVRATADVCPTEKPLKAPFFDVKEEGGDKRRTGPVEFAIDRDDETAWTTDSGPATRNQPRKAVFVADKPFGFADGTKLAIRMEQSHGGPNGNDRQNYLMGRYRFSLTTAIDPVADPLPASVRQLIESKEPEAWTEEEWADTFSYWRTTVADWSEANERIESLLEGFPVGDFQLVTSERSVPRTTHRMERGDFLSPAEVVEPHTPSFLHPFPADAPRNRLGFAQWLVDRESPTTARAIVNRVWQAYFGIGLVETPEDLGSQAPPASHPQLLDWLAVEFMDHGWSFKHLHRLIVDSATYRQSSKRTARQTEVDPRNRLLARGPRMRVDAEIVRDIALTASGLLNHQVGGRSVYPPAPELLFLPPASYGPKNWFTENDQQRYRRSIYVHAYRSVPYPPLQVFDAPNGDAACVRRARSNTPLQALTLLNEPQFVECSRALAARVHQEPDLDDDAGIRRAFRLCLTRRPADEEVALLQKLLDQSRARYAKQPTEARTVVGIETKDEEHSNQDAEVNLAAWTIVCRVILNLDETITKQ